MLARLRAAQQGGLELRTTGVVVAQVWRDPAGRQAELARLLKAVDVTAVDRAIGQEGGVLLGHAKSGDAIDATLVATARSGDRIVTSDAPDISALVEASRRRVLVVLC